MSKLACVLAILAMAYASNSIATTVLGIRTPDAFVMAVDSKIVTVNGPETFLGCKIDVSKNVIFAGSGVLRNGSGSFNVYDSARKAIAAGRDLDDIARRFGHDAAARLPAALSLISAPERNAYGLNAGDDVFGGVFAKIDNGILRVAVVKVRPASETTATYSEQLCPGEACNGSEAFLAQLGWLDTVTRQLDADHTIWREKGVVGALNELILNEATAHPAMVGAPVAVVAMTRAGEIRWIQKGEC